MIRLSKAAVLLFSILAFIILAGQYTNAQIETGSITGTVKDTSGAVMRGIQITLTGVATGVSQTAKSTSTGTYVFDAVNPGQYTLRATAGGFKESLTEGLTVNVQQTLTVDITLQPGGSNAQVVVTAKAPLLQTENGALGQTVDSEMVNDLPLVGRDWVSLAQISAGVATAYIGEPSQDAGTTGSAYFVVNGVNLWQNDIRLNGINDNIEMYGGSTIGSNATITPPPDAIQQFRLQSGDYSAEFGHSTGAVVNAVTQSGTNSFHGDVWDYLRNNVLQANSYFLKQAGQPIAPYRQNLFGGVLGGPIIRDKAFFFVSYQGLRSLESYSVYSPSTSTVFSVPTANEQSSNFTNLQDIINLNVGTTTTDSLGRVFPFGTVMDPATTRNITKGATDPVTGITSPNTGTVRDPFYTGGSISGITNFVGKNQYLNQLPAGRLDPNAVALLHYFPLPTTSTTVTNNYLNNPQLIQHQDQEDARVDYTISANDTMFVSGDYSHLDVTLAPFIPGILVGEGTNGEANSYPVWASAIGYNHVFSPSLFNEFHVGYDHFIEDVRSDWGNTFGIPAQFGIQGIPQIPNNGGLPYIAMGGLQTVGVHTSTPTLETIHALEFMDNLTKVHAAHVFKMGYQIDFIAGDIIQPPAGHGEFTFNGQYSQPTNNNRGNTGIADILLTPIAPSPTLPNPVAPKGGSPYVEGGLSSFSGSNYASTDDTRKYMGAYFQDDWKILPTLTLNLGIRWDYTTPYVEAHGRQANFIANGGNGPGGIIYMTPKGCQVPTSATYQALLAKDGITTKCTTDLGNVQHFNFAPRVGFNWRLNPSVVLRGGYGIAYGSLSNLGYGGTLGTNYPFVYTVNNTSGSSSSIPNILTNGETATMENTFGVVNLEDPTLVNGSGLSLYGRQYNFQTPYVQIFNLMFQKQFTGYDAFQIGYVGALGRHLDNIFFQHNSPSEVLKTGTALAPDYVPFPDFATNSDYETTIATSNYNSLQATYQHDFHAGLNLIGNYTWSKCLSDQQTQARGGGLSYRAPWVPGFGIQGDYGLCDADAADIIHVAGTYQLPVGHGQAYGNNMKGWLDAIAGGWSVNFISSYQTGQPFTLSCGSNPTANGCFADVYQNVDMYARSAGAHTQKQWLNPAAFYNPPAVTGPDSLASLGGMVQQARGPSFYNLDSSIFKNFDIHEAYKLQFRAESFNTLNSTELAAPTTQNNYSNLTNFSEITALRHPPRIIQLAAKIFF